MATEEPKKTKSEAVRNYLEEHPEARPSEVVDALKKRGFTVRPGLVSNLKFQRSRPNQAAPAPAAASEPQQFSIREVLAAKRALDMFNNDLNRLLAAAKQIKETDL